MKIGSNYFVKQNVNKTKPKVKRSSEWKETLGRLFVRSEKNLATSLELLRASENEIKKLKVHPNRFSFSQRPKAPKSMPPTSTHGSTSY